MTRFIARTHSVHRNIISYGHSCARCASRRKQQRACARKGAPCAAKQRRRRFRGRASDVRSGVVGGTHNVPRHLVAGSLRIMGPARFKNASMISE